MSRVQYPHFYLLKLKKYLLGSIRELLRQKKNVARETFFYEVQIHLNLDDIPSRTYSSLQQQNLSV